MLPFRFEVMRQGREYEEGGEAEQRPEGKYRSRHRGLELYLRGRWGAESPG